MIRVVFTVALTVALLGAALPAIEAGSVERTAIRLDATAEDIERTARTLVADEDPSSPGTSGARRLVRFRLPADGWADAPVSYFAVGGHPNGTGDESVVAYRIEGRPARTVRLPGLDLRTPDGPVVFRGAGRHRLVLSLVRDRGVAVVARRATDAGPVDASGPADASGDSNTGR
ncbi:MAG: hypothetical protein ABEJ78_04400 [Haloferacaceae archaeon]